MHKPVEHQVLSRYASFVVEHCSDAITSLEEASKSDDLRMSLFLLHDTGKLLVPVPVPLPFCRCVKCDAVNPYDMVCTCVGWACTWTEGKK